MRGDRAECISIENLIIPGRAAECREGKANPFRGDQVFFLTEWMPIPVRFALAGHDKGFRVKVFR